MVESLNRIRTAVHLRVCTRHAHETESADTSPIALGNHEAGGHGNATIEDLTGPHLLSAPFEHMSERSRAGEGGGANVRGLA